VSLPGAHDADLPEVGEVLDFLRVIWRVDQALQRTSKRMQASSGITAQQRLVLRIVGRFPGIPAGQVARLLRVHPSTLTGLLKRLGAKGLIHRRTDPSDARRTLLSLTVKGRQRTGLQEGTVEAAVRTALERSSPGSVAAARAVLLRIAESLDAEAPSAPAPVRRRVVS
jgi:DNA-binding MarR family transcriptional regulator